MFEGVQMRHIPQGLKNPLMHLQNLLEYSRAVAYQQITIRLPSELAEVLVENARQKGISLNGYILDILTKSVQKPKGKAKKQSLLNRILSNKELCAAFLWRYYSTEKHYYNVPNFERGTIEKVLLWSPSVLEKIEQGTPYTTIIKQWYKKLPENEKQLWKEAVELWGKTVCKTKGKAITTNAIAKACLSINLDEANPKQLAHALGTTYGVAYKLMPLVLEFDESTDYRVKEILASLQMLDEVQEAKLKGRDILVKTFPELNLEF